MVSDLEVQAIDAICDFFLHPANVRADYRQLGHERLLNNEWRILPPARWDNNAVSAGKQLRYLPRRVLTVIFDDFATLLEELIDSLLEFRWQWRHASMNGKANFGKGVIVLFSTQVLRGCF